MVTLRLKARVPSLYSTSGLLFTKILRSVAFCRRIVKTGFEVMTSNPIPSWWLTPLATTSGECCGGGELQPPTAIYPGEAPEGQSVAYVGFNQTEIAQVLSAQLVADQTYRLQVEIENRTDLALMPLPGETFWPRTPIA